MGHPKEESRCTICNKLITEKDMIDGKVEMIKGPEPIISNNNVIDFKKVFVCTHHEGVAAEIKEENNGQ